ncbi:MAG TPA: DUF4870 domain-containing protein [Actinomycetes bacterium]|jgi:hypothetical protein
MQPDDERLWATLAHLSAFLGFVGIPVIGPLVIFLIFGNRSQYVRHHSAEALNFNITMLGAAIVSGLLILVVIGLVLLPIIALTWFILTIVATIAANRGEWYRYPLTIRLVN